MAALAPSQTAETKPLAQLQSPDVRRTVAAIRSLQLQGLRLGPGQTAASPAAPTQQLLGSQGQGLCAKRLRQQPIPQAQSGIQP